MKKFLNIFVETDDTPEVEKPKAKPVTGWKTQPPTEDVQVYVPTAPSEDMTAHFEEVLATANTNNFPGTDFYEFYSAKKSISEYVQVEEGQYKAAFNTLKAQGLTKEKLLTTANQYTQVIENETKDFDASYNQLYDQNVTQKKKAIESKMNEIQKLSERLAQLQLETKSVTQEIEQAERNLTNKRNEFLSGADDFKNKLAMEIDKINTYIK